MMDKFDRVFQLHAILVNRRTPIQLEDLTARLECSRATLYRIAATLKDALGAPLEFDRETGGFVYRRDAGDAPFELPGLWFTPGELQALLTLEGLLKERGGGLLDEHLAPLVRVSRYETTPLFNLSNLSLGCERCLNGIGDRCR